jgi:hypothetical protein
MTRDELEAVAHRLIESWLFQSDAMGSPDITLDTMSHDILFYKIVEVFEKVRADALNTVLPSDGEMQRAAVSHADSEAAYTNIRVGKYDSFWAGVVWLRANLKPAPTTLVGAIVEECIKAHEKLCERHSAAGEK